VPDRHCRAATNAAAEDPALGGRALLQRAGGAARDPPPADRSLRVRAVVAARVDLRRRRQPRRHAGDPARAAAAGPARARGFVLAQLRPPVRRDGRPGPCGRRCGLRHRRRPAGPARGHPADAGALARWRRRGLWRAHRERWRVRVQAVDRQAVLPDHQPHVGHADPAGHRRLPPDGPQRGRGVPGHARARPLRARHGGLGRVPAGGGALPARGALCRQHQVPAEEDAALRLGRHHVVLDRAAAAGDLRRVLGGAAGDGGRGLRLGLEVGDAILGRRLDAPVHRGAVHRRRAADVHGRAGRVHRPHLRRGQATPAVPGEGAAGLRAAGFAHRTGPPDPHARSHHPPPAATRAHCAVVAGGEARM
ncbi:MAG: Glycosyltransferase, partial [uncultured Ramlibacter sp.]